MSVHISLAWRVRLALVVAIASISMAAIFFRLAAPTHPLVMSAIRLSLATCCLMGFTYHAIKNKRISWPIARAGVIAGLCYAAHFGCWVWSLTLTSVAASTTLVTATPIFLALYGLITKKEPPSKQIMIALGVACLGILLITGTDFGLDTHALQGDCLALGGAIAMAVYLLNVRRLGPNLPILAFSGIATCVGAMTLWLIIFISNIPVQVPHQTAWICLVLAALIPQLIGHTLITWSLKHISATTAGIATLAEPVGSTILGALILKEIVPGHTLIGCAITLGAVALALRATATTQKKKTIN